MKHLLSTAILLAICLNLIGQDLIKKSDIVIHITGHDAWVDHQFFVDIYKRGNSAKLVYSYRDGVKYAEARKDKRFDLLRTKQQQFTTDDPKRAALTDTILKLYQYHSAFTRDSITINLKKDINYNNLLQRFSEATKEELAPKIEHTWLDGCTISTTIITIDRNSEIHTDTPGEATHPLLMSFIRNTLSKKKDSEVIRKVLKFYVEYK